MDPVTIGLTVASAGLKIFGSIFGGSSAKKAANARAKLLEDAAAQDLNESGVNAQIAVEEGDRLQARAATLAAASGGGTAGGVLDVLQDLQRQSLFEAKAAIYSGMTASRAKHLQANAERKAGKDAFVSSLVNAGSTLLGAAGSLASQSQNAGLSQQLGY
jgi:hypothetical protein